MISSKTTQITRFTSSKSTTPRTSKLSSVKSAPAKTKHLSIEEAYQRYMNNFKRVTAVVIGERNPLTFCQDDPTLYIFNKNYDVIYTVKNIYYDDHSERYNEKVQEILRHYRVNYREIDRAESVEDNITGSFMEFRGEYAKQLNIVLAKEDGEMDFAPSSEEFVTFQRDVERFCEYERYHKYYMKPNVMPELKWLDCIQWKETVGKIRVYKFR